MGVAGLGTVAVSAPIIYYSEKFSNEQYEKARVSGGILNKLDTAESNIRETKYYYDLCWETKSKKLPKERRSGLRETYYFALQKI